MPQKNKKSKKSSSSKKKNSKPGHSTHFSGGKTKRERKNRRGRGWTHSKDSKEWIDHYLEFSKKLEPHNIVLHDIKGDGNCLFRAFSHQLIGHEDAHFKFREVAVKYVEEQKEIFQFYLEEDDLSIEDYIKHLKEEGSWGGFTEIYALSMALKVNVEILRFDMTLVSMKSFSGPSVFTVYLAFHEGATVVEHYSSLRGKDDDIESPARPINLSFATPAQTGMFSQSLEIESDFDICEQLSKLKITA